MKEQSRRQLQVGEEIRRSIAIELNNSINFYSKNDFLTIIKVIMSKDLRFCKVYYRCKIENNTFFQTQLDKLKKQISNYLYKKLKMKTRPEINFYFDDTLIEINKINKAVAIANQDNSNFKNNIQ